MRVNGDNAPAGAFTVEEQPDKPGYVCVRLYENAQFIESHWEYDEYQLIVPHRKDISADIESNFGEWLETARNLEILGSPSYVADMKEALEILLGVSE